ncbi:hypothetical protein VL22_0201950 [Escherichia fergusonii]|nr:hypothetical protein VL22_0201950 [Escherichia fergusonii]
MMGTICGAKWVNGVHSTCSIKKLTGTFTCKDCLQVMMPKFVYIIICKDVVTNIMVFLLITDHQDHELV